MSKIHIGKRIQDRAKKTGIGATVLAKKIGMTRAGIYAIFKKEIIDTELLRKFSEALSHDFFRDFSEGLSVADPNEAIGFATKSELKGVEQKLEALSRKIDRLIEEIPVTNKSSYNAKSRKGRK